MTRSSDGIGCCRSLGVQFDRFRDVRDEAMKENQKLGIEDDEQLIAVSSVPGLASDLQEALSTTAAFISIFCGVSA